MSGSLSEWVQYRRQKLKRGKPRGIEPVLHNKRNKFGAGFFMSGKAEEAQIAPLSKLTTTRHDIKKTSEMCRLFFNSS
jgi:hypothetical protein